MGALNVAVDAETGRLRPVTPAEAKKIAFELRKQFGVKAHAPVLHADGMLSVVLGTDYLSFSTARIGADGKVVRECAAGADATTEFLTASGPGAPAAEEK
jgi:hypothetical protein